MAKVQLDGECWLWTGSISRAYGQFRLDNKVHWAHRIAYAIFNGTIPNRMDVHHNCHNALCVNPDHIELLTRGDNATDANKRRVPEVAADKVPF